jgi:hypothetical protein
MHPSPYLATIRALLARGYLYSQARAIAQTESKWFAKSP